MIQANELRIGNLIYFPFIGQEIEVIGIALHENFGLRIQAKDKDGSIYFEPIEVFDHIPLTEEWLLRFGFIDNEYTMELDGLILGWGSRIVSTKERNSWSCQDYPHIKYVHQLQNLYFVLTNTELTLKDN